MSTILPYGYPLEVSFKNTDNMVIDSYSGERQKTYGVVTTYTTPSYTQSIQYEMTVTHLYKHRKSNLWQVQLDKSPVYINRASPDRLIDRLHEAFMLQVLYPMVLWVNTKGRLSAIENYEEIVERFKKFKVQKQKEYTGLYMERYWQLLQDNIADPYTLQKSLEKDWFITLFFTPLYAPMGYMGNTTLQTYLPSPLAYEHAIYYDGILQRPQAYVRNHTIGMQFKADSPQRNTDVTVDYQINTRAFTISEVQAKAQLYKEKKAIKTVATAIIHLREKDRYKYPEEKQRVGVYQRFLDWLNT